MPQFVKLPDPIHASLKALAAARGKTMVQVIADTVRQAVEAGEIAPEAAGVSAKLTLLLDLDASNERDQGPFVVVTTPKGELPHMTRADAEAVADFLLGEGSSDAVRHVRENAGKRWTVEARGTSLVLTGTPAGKNAQPVAFVMAPVVARDLAQQVRKIASKAA